MPEAVTEPVKEVAQALSTEQQRKLQRVVEILLAGYQAWLVKQSQDKK